MESRRRPLLEIQNPYAVLHLRNVMLHSPAPVNSEQRPSNNKLAPYSPKSECNEKLPSIKLLVDSQKSYNQQQFSYMVPPLTIYPRPLPSPPGGVQASPFQTFQLSPIELGSPCSLPQSDTQSNRSVSPVYSHMYNGRPAARDDRHEYDLEEKFALCFLRICFSEASQLRWKEVVLKAWAHLFPPGTARRPSAPLPPGKTLPPNYPHRSNGGLQCRYYRVREAAGMGTVRAGRRHGSRAEKDGLRRLEMALVVEWLKLLHPVEAARLALQRSDKESEPAFLNRARQCYRHYSEFWPRLQYTQKWGYVIDF